jgi:hypothetical protein
MPQLHARGVELVVELLDAAEYVGQIPAAEHRKLLRETAHVLAELLKRDLPDHADAPKGVADEGTRPEDLNAANDD